MDYDIKLRKNTFPSILQSNETFSNKILARQSTVDSYSSRFFYRAAEGVPFQWEKQPGTSITAQPEDVLLPINPPPAVLAMGLPKPCTNAMGVTKPRKWSSAWLMKKIKNIKKTNNLGGTSNNISNTGSYPNFGSERYGCVSGRSSPSSFGSTSTSTSSSNVSFGDHNQSSDDNNTPFTCGPSRLSDLVVYFGRKD